MTQNCRKWIRHASPEHALASPSNLFRRWCLLPSKGALLLSSSVFHSTFFQKLNDLLNITEDSVIHSMFFQKSNVLLNIKANPTRRSDFCSVFSNNQREYQNVPQQPANQTKTQTKTTPGNQPGAVFLQQTYLFQAKNYLSTLFKVPINTGVLSVMSTIAYANDLSQKTSFVS